ncbi:GMC family oxidoreductase N-terminal domain-containing protein [Luteimonas sp. BDR2-5]|uniref:GMC family oxidoreductase n=1 Tax=Proluteimonas luteida TaxID=2878685 RepID=UPI001E45E1E4|nr:GMC family oxidoreductase N-terminal domain-containing protein [Luteimonas sp. BDR2-5]MCD9028716.1 GMC family oxidoreductase N-terminal domain-containing protein [Luteimonas sp. BDR2-5]
MPQTGYDYVIVGAGSAGCVLADRLSASCAHSVLLLEAGGEDRLPFMSMPLAFLKICTNPKVGWGYTGEPEAHADGRRIWAPRGRVLGGCSSINGMLYARGHALDFDDWAARGLPGWSYREVLPYFQRAEDHWRGADSWHGAGGPMRVVEHAPDDILYPRLAEAARSLGHPATADYHGRLQEGFCLPQLNIQHGRRGSTATCYLKPARQRPNLTVATGAQATRLLLERGRATGVRYLQDGQEHVAHAGREVIVAAGAFNSPQLLMLSGIGDDRQLRPLGIATRHALTGVGANLQDHPSVRVEYDLSGPYGFDRHLRFDRMARTVVEWKLLRRGLATDMPVTGMLFLRTRDGLDRPDGQTLVTPTLGDAHLWFPGIRAGRGHMLSTANVLLRPDSRGSLKLRSGDPLDKPAIHFNLLAEESDRLFFRRYVRHVRELIGSAAMAPVIGRENRPGIEASSDAEIDAFVRWAIGTAFHPVGTCAMGTGEDAVVDAQLRVHGLDGLRVVDASVMPRIVGGNTNAATIMIAEKAADMILERPPLPPAPAGVHPDIHDSRRVAA